MVISTRYWRGTGMVDSEHVEQRNFVKWFRQKYTLNFEKIEIAAIPNGGHRNKIQAAALKAEGVNAGIPDMIIPITEGKSIWIEMKKKEGFSISNEQKRWKKMLTHLGHYYILAIGCDDAILKLEKLLDDIKEKEKWIKKKP